MKTTKVYLVEMNSSVGGLLERLRDMGQDIKITFQPTNDIDFWAIEIETPDYKLPWVEDAIADYV